LDVALPDLDGDCLRTEEASHREPTAAYQHDSNPPRMSQMRVKVAEGAAVERSHWYVERHSRAVGAAC
jgi:hypothetical protein